MTHYYTDNSDLEKNEKDFHFVFDGHSYTFTTYSGVFSKDKIDYGSFAFLKILVNQDLGKRILDLGCGYGPIGIILKSKFKEIEIEMIDVNPRAIELTGINASKNKVEVKTYVSDLYSNVSGKFDTIVTNPPIRTGKENIYKIFTEAYDYLDEKGSLYVVIRKQQGAKSAVKKIEEIFGNCTIIARDKGYFVLIAKKLLTI